MKTKKLVATLAMAALAVGATATTATAEDTVATLAVTAPGSLAISVPVGTTSTPLDLGSVAADAGTYAPSLGSVTVTDSRAALVATWIATATGTHFDLQTTGADPASDPNQRIANTAIIYTATPSLSSGTGTPTFTTGSMALGATMAFAGSGSNVVTWDPTLTMTILPSQVAGTYQGTITHSFS